MSLELRVRLLKAVETPGDRLRMIDLCRHVKSSVRYFGNGRSNDYLVYQ